MRDALDGTNGRDKKDRWVPRWMQFPPSAYSQRGGVGTVSAHARVEAAMQGHDAPQPDPGAPGNVVPLPDDSEEGIERLAA